MDLIIFHPSRMESSPLWTLINSSTFRDNKLVHFYGLDSISSFWDEVIHFMDFILESSTLWTIFRR